MHDLLRGDVAPPPALPPGHAGRTPFTAATFLEGLSSCARDALAVAYFRQWGIELADDINATQWIWNRGDVNRALTGRADTGFADAANAMLAPLAAWTTSTVQSIDQRMQDPLGTVQEFADAANNAWNATVNTANEAAQLLRSDPLQFVQTAGEVWLNSQTVMANTLTFGLIPGLNGIADQIVADHGFYRAVQVVGVIGREAALAALTGGTGNALGAGARGLSLVARYAAPMAGRMATRLLVRTTGRALASTIVRASAALVCRATTAYRLAQPYFLYQQVAGISNNLAEARAALQRGDYEAAAALVGRTAAVAPHAWASARDTFRLFNALRSLNPQTIGNFLAACFAAGTPILGEHGSKPVEQYEVGDRVWARDENDPNGPAELKKVEEVFVRQGLVWHVHVGGQVIRTTGEHPFWVRGQGWTKVCALKPGDLLVGHDAQGSCVEDVLDTGEVETVFNFRVADHHTYYVGSDAWRFSVWAHNACSLTDMATAAGQPDRGGLTRAGRALAKHGGRPGSAFPAPTGAPAAVNRQAQTIVEEILTDPNGTTVTRHHALYGTVIEVRDAARRGLRFDSTGTRFLGFLEP
jgi:hypothetical protein